MCFFMLQTFYDAFPHTIHSCHESAHTWFHLMCCHRSCNTYAWLRTSRFLRKLSWGWAPKVINLLNDLINTMINTMIAIIIITIMTDFAHYRWAIITNDEGSRSEAAEATYRKLGRKGSFVVLFFCNLRFLNTHIQVDKGGEERIGICLLKSLSRDELPEDLSTIRFPVRS